MKYKGGYDRAMVNYLRNSFTYTGYISLLKAECLLTTARVHRLTAFNIMQTLKKAS